MNDELLAYYKNELSFIRRMGAEFAESYPKIAERLRLSADACQDPHVERMIEAFSLLTARVRKKLDDEFPEVAQAMLETLYPQRLAPMPSMAIVQVHLDPAQAELTAGYSVPKHTLLDSEPTTEGPCRFRTCYPVTVWPIEVGWAGLRQPSSLPYQIAKAAAVLRVELRCLGPEVTFGKMEMPALRFYLKGQDQHVLRLYELIHNNTLAVALAQSAKDASPTMLDGGSIKAVGFEDDQGMLPYSARLFPGYRLLSEYFSFPQKFLFFEVTGLTPQVLSRFGNSMELQLHLTRTLPELEQNISGETFRLGCAPVVNLFPRQAEPIQITQRDSEYRIVPDSRRPISYEVYSVESVIASLPGGQEIAYQPFYSIRHGMVEAKTAAFWHSIRRYATRSDEQVDHGTEVFVSLVDLELAPAQLAEAILNVQALCLNRDLPAREPVAGGRPGFRPMDGGPVSIECLTQPTPTRRLPLEKGMLWRLISHLMLNHLSLADSAGGPEALREILKLYDWVDSDDTRSKIAGINSVRHQRTVGRVPGVVGGGFCRGVEVTVDFDETRFADNSLFLFSAVLERFLAIYCSINSFTQLVATSRQRSGEIRQWTPRVAQRSLV